MKKFTTKKIIAALKKHNHPFFKGDYNLNLIGVRSSDTDANTFNDFLVVLCEIDGKQEMYVFPMTTDPGVYYRESPINVNGTAVLVPGHYRACWKIGAHRGQYHALVQRGEMAVYRDNSHDSEIDFDGSSVETGFFGINLHRANKNRSSLRVDKWSAGCQVLANPEDFDFVMKLVDESAKKYGDKFSYTLLEEDDL